MLFRSFHRLQNKIAVRSKEESQELERLRKIRAERAALRQRTANWLSGSLAHKADEPYPVPEEQEVFLRGVIDYLLCGTNSDAVNLLGNAHPKWNAREVGIRVLHATHRMPEGVDEFLLVNGIHAGFSKQALEAVEAIPRTFETAGRETIAEPMIFSIDDEETREIDDASPADATAMTSSWASTSLTPLAS